MKRIFQHHNSNKNSQDIYTQFIGKSFQLSKCNVYVEDVIAEGGFALVFLVKCSSNGQKYALKRMYVNNDADLIVCKREISIIKSLSDHKNILKYIDSSITKINEDIYEILILTKYYKSGHLVSFMNERLNIGFNENEILKIFCDVCEGVSQLHKLGIIHRDIKVENVLIDEFKDGTLNYILCDFGSSTNRILDTKLMNIQAISDELQKYTTLSYRSPEMIDLYSNRQITTKSDIWALGCLLFKICYFSLPFGESLLAIQEGRFFIPENSRYSKQLNSLIKYMLEVDPDKRPDIYQVSFVAFSLARRQCPVSNIENSSIPNINELPVPMTENEWKKYQLSKSIKNTNQTQSTTIESGTSVNPRLRPKGLSNVVNNNIVNLSLKPPINQNMTTNINTQPNTFNDNSNMSNGKLINGFDDDFSKVDLVQKPPPPSRGHRRSFSHASLSNENSSSGSTPTQLALNNYLNVQQPLTTRSTSASPLTNNSVQATVKVTLNPNNPFGDNFVQMNDNDIFGLEFDQIRKTNSPNGISPISLNNHLTATQTNSIEFNTLTKLNNNETVDPFRSAPFTTETTNTTPSSSSSLSESTNSLTKTNDLFSKTSAFQPYKRSNETQINNEHLQQNENDNPFLNAPFKTTKKQTSTNPFESNHTKLNTTKTRKTKLNKTNSNGSDISYVLAQSKSLNNIISNAANSNTIIANTLPTTLSNTSSCSSSSSSYSIANNVNLQSVQLNLPNLSQYTSSASNLINNNNNEHKILNKLKTIESNEYASSSPFKKAQQQKGISNMSFDDY